MATSPSDKLAVLIDADNAQASIAAELLAEISRYGTATIKRAYGDWTMPNLREAGLAVYGFGEKKTPQPFVAACDKFIYTEILRPQPSPDSSAADAPAPLEPMLRAAITATARDNGWAALSAVGSLIVKNSPSFDSRNYGCQKLGELVRKQPYLEVKELPVGDESTNVHLFVRLREA